MSLIAWYPLNGDAKDYSGNLLNGTVYGPIVTTGINGDNCYNFDGVNDYIEIPANHELLTEDISISMWIYKRSSGYIGCLIGSRTDSADGLMFYFDNSSVLQLDYTGNGYLRWNTGYIVPSDQWIHIVVSVDRNGRYLYIDGEYYGESTIITEKPSSNVPLYIGCINNSMYYFNGNIQDVRMYNRAITPTEVAILYDMIPANIKDLKYMNNTIYLNGEIREI